MNESERIKELESTIDSYGIQILLMKAEITANRLGLMELASFLLKDDELSNFRQGYYETLLEKSNDLCNPLDSPFSQSEIAKALFELELNVRSQLK